MTSKFVLYCVIMSFGRMERKPYKMLYLHLYFHLSHKILSVSLVFLCCVYSDTMYIVHHHCLCDIHFHVPLPVFCSRFYSCSLFLSLSLPLSFLQLSIYPISHFFCPCSSIPILCFCYSFFFSLSLSLPLKSYFSVAAIIWASMQISNEFQVYTINTCILICYLSIFLCTIHSRIREQWSL